MLDRNGVSMDEGDRVRFSYRGDNWRWSSGTILKLRLMHAVIAGDDAFVRHITYEHVEKVKTEVSHEMG